MNKDKFSEYYATGEVTNGNDIPNSDKSFEGSNLGVSKSDLKRGLTEGPRKFSVIEDDPYERLPQGHDRI